MRRPFVSEKQPEEPKLATLGLGSVAAVINVASQVRKAVLILGARGTGKREVAKEIHAKGPHQDAGFMEVYTLGLDDDTAHGRLFGRGSIQSPFTQIKDGTIYLPDVEVMDPFIQNSMLGVIQNGEFHKAGSTKILTTDARVIISTSIVETALLEKQRLTREQLSELVVRLPTLQERKERDQRIIQVLAERFMKKFGKGKILSSEAFEWLYERTWRLGNIKQLEEVIQYACVAASSSDIITPETLKIFYNDDQEPVKQKRGAVKAGLVAPAAEKDASAADEASTVKAAPPKKEKKAEAKATEEIVVALSEIKTTITIAFINKFAAAFAATLENGDFVELWKIFDQEMTGLEVYEFWYAFQDAIAEKTQYTVVMDENSNMAQLVETAPARLVATAAPAPIITDDLIEHEDEEDLIYVTLDAKGTPAKIEELKEDKPNTFKCDRDRFTWQVQKLILNQIFDNQLRGRSHVSAYKALITTLAIGEPVSFADIRKLTQLKQDKLQSFIPEMTKLIESKTKSEFTVVRRGKSSIRLVPTTSLIPKSDQPETDKTQNGLNSVNPGTELGIVLNDKTAFKLECGPEYQAVGDALLEHFKKSLKQKNRQFVFKLAAGEKPNTVVIKLRVTNDSVPMTFRIASNIVDFYKIFSSATDTQAINDIIHQNTGYTNYRSLFATMENIDTFALN